MTRRLAVRPEIKARLRGAARPAGVTRAIEAFDVAPCLRVLPDCRSGAVMSRLLEALDPSV